MDQLVEWNTIGSPPYDTFVKIQDPWLYAVVFGQDANIKRGSAEHFPTRLVTVVCYLRKLTCLDRLLVTPTCSYY